MLHSLRNEIDKIAPERKQCHQRYGEQDVDPGKLAFGEDAADRVCGRKKQREARGKDIFVILADSTALRLILYPPYISLCSSRHVIARLR